MKPVLLAAALALAACRSDRAPAPAPAPAPGPVATISRQTIRVAVIGGMVETGFWPALADRFHHQTGHTVELDAAGPAQIIAGAFRKGGFDLITFHASDAFVNLVADGLAADPEPWARNDLVIVGPSDDPAHVGGDPDALDALHKIIDAKASIVVHASEGADGVLHALLEAGHLALPAEQAILFDGANQHEVLARAAKAHAYTIVGRIPVLDGKLAQPGMELLVRGDPRLRRPYLVAVASGAATDPRLAAARELVAYLRSPATQQWIATFGKGRYDDAPLFFPVTVR